MKIEKQLANDIRANDHAAYQQHRFPAISDGDSVVFENEDFTGADFDEFRPGFFEFHHCNLQAVRRLYGQPFTILDCSCQAIDMRGLTATIEAKGSDFTGMLYDDDTILARPENGEAGRSVFERCQFDSAARAHFEKQGVIFR